MKIFINHKIVTIIDAKTAKNSVSLKKIKYENIIVKSEKKKIVDKIKFFKLITIRNFRNIINKY